MDIRVAKFGGTSMGDAAAIRRAAEIVCADAKDRGLVVVVSAMSGVTDRLIAAAQRSATGDADAASDIAEFLKQKHHAAIDALIADPKTREALTKDIDQIIQEVSNFCRGSALLRELTPRTLDAISSFGERLSARMLATTIVALGRGSVAVEGFEVIVTDNVSGRAEPLMGLTRERVSTRLLPLIKEGSVPIVAGFTGGTTDGMLTTLGRGGSDYSATILAAAIGANDTVIWTDVDGVLTADPRLVKGARTLREISYNEAAELAYFGAKVLHPKTLRPVSEAGIPVWIKNSFQPDAAGTKITPTGHPTERGVKAITTIRDVTLITVGGRGIVGLPGVAAKTFTAAAAVQANILLISQSSSEYDICFVVNSADSAVTVSKLREAFASDLAHRQVEHITVDPEIAIVAVVGDMMRGMPGIAGRTFSALGRRSINIIAIAQGSSEYNVSFVVEVGAVRDAVQALHSEFELERSSSALKSLGV